MAERRETYNAGVSVQAMLESMAPGLDRAILRILSQRVGREMAISRPNLLTALKALGFDVHERQARAMINELRKKGHLICSTGGSEGGYWLAASWDELSEYLEREVHPRAMDLLEQEQALRRAGERIWGPESHQAKLF